MFFISGLTEVKIMSERMAVRENKPILGTYIDVI